MKWAPLLTSWLGRVAVVKMTLLPQNLYVFHVLLVIVPEHFFQALQKHILYSTMFGGP